MSSSPSLYRRHRPRSFDDVVGQEAVVRTLRNAVERGRVHHAYLFVGSRGTGKTSMAKILAACLNCERGGPTPTPCGECDSCVSIAAATSLDVIEMDAASNNSVEDIRELRESVAFAPVSGRSKVYILDEAHMLSSAAWNAFLKTLEEPPPNTIFVLATTEAQKVLPTVVDRCHRFDFARPSAEQVGGVLSRVAAVEGITIGPEAVALIARSATGSFRDALGTLEQLQAYAGDAVGIEDVVAVLGVADAELLGAIVDAVAGGSARDVLVEVARGVSGGRDATGLMRDLEVRARELMVVGLLGGEVPAELSVTPDADAALVAQAGRVPAGVVVRMLELLAEALEAVKAGADGRTQLELALVKAAAPEVDGSAKALLARLERVERAVGGGDAVVSASAGVPGTDLVGATSSPAVSEGATGTPSPGPEHPGSGAPTPPGDAGNTNALAPQTPAAAASAPTPADASPAGVGASPTHSRVGEVSHPAADGAAVASDAAPPSTDLASPPTDAGLNVDLGGLVEVWSAVVEVIQSEKPLLAAVVAEARPVAVDGRDITIAFAPDNAFLRRKAEDQENRVAIAEAVRVVTGQSFALRFDTRELEAAGVEPPQPTEEELVARFMSEFDAEIVEEPVPETDGPIGAA